MYPDRKLSGRVDGSFICYLEFFSYIYIAVSQKLYTVTSLKKAGEKIAALSAGKNTQLLLIIILLLLAWEKAPSYRGKKMFSRLARKKNSSASWPAKKSTQILCPSPSSLMVCLSVCQLAISLLNCLTYDHNIWHVGSS